MSFRKNSPGNIGLRLPIKFSQTNNRFLIGIYKFTPLLLFGVYMNYSTHYSSELPFTIENIGKYRELQILILGALFPLYLLYLRNKYSKQKESIAIDNQIVSYSFPYKNISWQQKLGEYGFISGNVREYQGHGSNGMPWVEYRLTLNHKTDSRFNIDLWLKSLDNHMHLFGEDKKGNKAKAAMKENGRLYSILLNTEFRYE